MTHLEDQPLRPREREARAARILDAAAGLLLRHGYRRVTIDDVARDADIGKGTVYLHWRTREELFSAVFQREVLEAVGGLMRALEQDRRAVLPHNLARAYFLAIMERPLLRGFVLGDRELLGRLARSVGDREGRHQLMSNAYFELLAEHGQLHDDLSPENAAYAFLALFEGFLRAEANTGELGAVDLQRRADLLAISVQRAFETGRELPPATEDVLAQSVIGLLRGLLEADPADRDGAT